MDKTASKKEIGNFIKARMLEKGLASRDHAESASVSEAAVRRWFRGETQPDTGKLPFVAKSPRCNCRRDNRCQKAVDGVHGEKPPGEQDRLSWGPNGRSYVHDRRSDDGIRGAPRARFSLDACRVRHGVAAWMHALADYDSVLGLRRCVPYVLFRLEDGVGLKPMCVDGATVLAIDPRAKNA